MKELSQIKDFLLRNLYTYDHYKDMKPDSNQPARLYGTNKTPKVENFEGITVANLKLRPTIDQTGTFTYNAAKVISEYLRPLCKNEYSINDTQKCPNISSIPTKQDGKEDLSYDLKYKCCNRENNQLYY